MNIEEIVSKLKSSEFKCITLQNGSYYLGETDTDSKGKVIRKGFGIQVNYYKEQFADSADFDSSYRGNWNGDSMDGQGA